MTPVMERLLMEAVVVLLQHNTEEKRIQQLREYGFSDERDTKGERLVGRIQENLSLVGVKPENSHTHAYFLDSVGVEAEWMCILCGEVCEGP